MRVRAMSDSMFQCGLMGEPDLLPDKRTRARWVVAESFRELAKQEDRTAAARLRFAAGRIENGQMPTKKIIWKIGHRRLGKAFEIFKRLCASRISENTKDQATPRGHAANTQPIE